MRHSTAPYAVHNFFLAPRSHDHSHTPSTHALPFRFPGVSVLFSFIVLSFVAHLDDALGMIFAAPETLRRCEEFLNGNGKVKIHWLWNRIIAISMATVGTVSVLHTEQLMRSSLIKYLRQSFFHYPLSRNRAAVEWRGSESIYDNDEDWAACNQLYHTLLVTTLFVAWVLALLIEVKLLMVGPTLQRSYPPKCLKLPTQFWNTRPTCSRSWFTNALTFASRFFIDFAYIFCAIFAIWWIFAVMISGALTTSDRVPNHGAR